MNSPTWPEFEFARDFMAVLLTCKFEDDSIKSEGAIFSNMSMGKIFIAQGRVTLK